MCIYIYIYIYLLCQGHELRGAGVIISTIINGCMSNCTIVIMIVLSLTMSISIIMIIIIISSSGGVMIITIVIVRGRGHELRGAGVLPAHRAPAAHAVHDARPPAHFVMIVGVSIIVIVIIVIISCK